MSVTDTARAGARVPGIDMTRWPDVAAVPRSPVRAAIAKRLFRTAVNRIPLRVVESGNVWYGGGTGTDPVFRLVRPEAFYHRVGETGTIGFGEAFMAGDWTTDDLPGVLAAFAANMKDMIPPARFVPDRALQHGERLVLSGIDAASGEPITHTLRVIHTPGHAANHLCLVLE